LEIQYLEENVPPRFSSGCAFDSLGSSSAFILTSIAALLSSCEVVSLIPIVTSSVESGKISCVSTFATFIDESLEGAIRLASSRPFPGFAVSAGDPSVNRLFI